MLTIAASAKKSVIQGPQFGHHSSVLVAVVTLLAGIEENLISPVQNLCGRVVYRLQYAHARVGLGDASIGSQQ